MIPSGSKISVILRELTTPMVNLLNYYYIINIDIHVYVNNAWYVPNIGLPFITSMNKTDSSSNWHKRQIHEQIIQPNKRPRTVSSALLAQ